MCAKVPGEKRLRQIKELEVEKLDADLRQASLKRTRNIYLFVGIVVIGLAGGLWSRLRYVHRSRAPPSSTKRTSVKACYTTSCLKKWLRN
ncbi:MAG: hypothetical protein IPI72_09960 [Flavobacteriales bacterium]|nr:hypothetical protein [Flavobacteriales bacterium]